MGFHITMRDGEGLEVRDLPDPFGGVFDASGDFDELVNEADSPTLANIEPYGNTVLMSAEMSVLLSEVDALLARVPLSRRKVRGRTGSAWRGLTRFRVMVDLCRADASRTLHVAGD